MSKATIESLGGGRFRLAGVLDATTVTGLLNQTAVHFTGLNKIEIDLADVAESDSAGLALLLEWLRIARRSDQRVGFLNIPAQIGALARISEVDGLLNGEGEKRSAES